MLQKSVTYECTQDGAVAQRKKGTQQKLYIADYYITENLNNCIMKSG